MDLAPVIINGLVSGSPYLILATIIICLLTGVISPKWVVTDLKEQLQEAKSVISKSVDTYEKINEQLKSNNLALDKVDRRFDQIDTTLRELLRDRRS